MGKHIRNNLLIAQLMFVIVVGFFMTQAHALVASDKKSVLNHPSKKAIAAKPQQEIVVLVHGLMRTTLSMYPLKAYLTRQGYQVYSYSYPSPRYSMHQHARSLYEYIDDLLAKNPGAKIHFVTHSMGGIITREALSKLSPKELKRVHSLVMLAPPNQGSYLAKLSTHMFPFVKSFIKPLSELSSEEIAYVHHVPIPKVNMGIIAGRYDAKVPPASARMNQHIDLRVVSSNHTFIMNNSEARKLIKNFLEKGTFAG